jgi:hypothetical protein
LAPPAAFAATASDTSPARPPASRVGSTTPARRPVPVVIFLNRSVQVSFADGQPRLVA